MTREPTSIKVDNELWRRFKSKCAEAGLLMSDVLEDLIKKYLGVKK